MVVKHPFIFREADVVVINKIDLAGPMRVSPDALESDALGINRKAKVVKTNGVTGEGVDELIQCMSFQ